MGIEPAATQLCSINRINKDKKSHPVPGIEPGATG